MNQYNLLKIEECFRDASVAEDLCHASMVKYTDSVKNFFSVIGDKQFEDLSVDDFKDYVLLAREKGASNARIANVISAMKWIIARLQQSGVVSKNLELDKIKKPKIDRREVAYLTETEVEMFIGAIRGDMETVSIRKARFYALAQFLLQTGARIGEVLSIDYEKINRQAMEVSIIGKGKKPRTLLLRPETLHALDRYLDLRKDDNPALFVSLNGKSRWMQTDVGRSFRRYRKISGIKKQFTIHTLRHTFATQMLFANVPMNVVQYMLGHSNLETTMKYYIGNIEQAKAREYMQDKYFDFISQR